ncbi:MAG TPA: hypothetical protein VNL18_08150 [Gemmatimonadales bacterium]|nr:hypothetical protein [Gemmatimonadales bacterium]
MSRLPGFLVAAVLAAACSDSGGVDPDAIESQELAAVQRALNAALAEDSLYPTLALLVFPFVDRASHLPDPSGDTTRLTGIELDIDVQTDSGPLVANFTVMLGWTDYQATTRTVDTVFFVAGAGRAPVDDALRGSFSPDSAGTGTALVMHQAPDSTVTVWQTGTGRLVTTSSTYGRGRTQTGGGLTVTVSRGTILGTFQVGAAYQLPDSATSVATAKDFSGGARALKVVIRGRF